MSTKPIATQVVPGAQGPESAAAEEGAVRARDSLFHWCGTVDAIRVTPHSEEKRAILVAYFEAVAAETIAPATRMFAGEIFPRDGSAARSVDSEIVGQAIQRLTRISDENLRARFTRLGDIASVAADAFAGRLPSGISVVEVAAWAEELAAESDPDGERDLVAEMLARLSSLEACYLVQLIVGDFRIGLDLADIEAAVRMRQPR
jgi:DNA ligase-like protein